MEKETAKIPGSLLARRWQHSDRSNQLVVRSKQPPDARTRLTTSTDGRRYSDRSNQLVVRSKQPPDARARLTTSTDSRRFFNVTITIATALFILVEGAMFILRSNFPTAPETKTTAYQSAKTLSYKSFRQQSPRFSSSASASTASKFLEKWEVSIPVAG
jgi:hypothetical protein